MYRERGIQPWRLVWWRSSRGETAFQHLSCGIEITLGLFSLQPSLLSKSLRETKTVSSTAIHQKILGDQKITSTSAERQKRSQNLAPVLVTISGNSLVFSRKIITSTAKLRAQAAFPQAQRSLSPSSGQAQAAARSSWSWEVTSYHSPLDPHSPKLGVH